MNRLFLGLASVILLAPLTPADGLRVAAWNITGFSATDTANLVTAVYGEFEGRSFAPDVILVQELTTTTSIGALVNALNSGLGAPADWTAAPFFTGSSGGLNNGVVYRASKLDLVATEFLWPGSTTANPRNLVRYDLRLAGYAADEAMISMYPVHMKSGTASSDQQRRLIEAQRLRADTTALPEGRHFMIGGDFNIQSSSQAAYQELTASQAENSGRVLDPIATPGNWNNNGAFRFIHTQDPVGAGGMDDRHDQILISGTLGDGEGLDYRGLFAQPWDLSTWDDPDHSYRCWGNDGSSFDTALRTAGNEMVGEAIAQALKSLAVPAGHLPVYLELIVPARIDADTLVLDFGTVQRGEPASALLTVSNDGDTDLWGPSGIQDLRYTMEAPAHFDAPAGPFVDAAGGGVNQHLVTMSTDASGIFAGTLIIQSNDPELPALEILLSGEVLDNCPADLAEPFGILDLADINVFTTAFFAQDPVADLAEPFGVLDLGDINAFTESFFAGCP
jgi:endonuclease/exonuclease/phosphatase family metal-dependent hydrolase